MNISSKALPLFFILISNALYAGNAYQCSTTLPVDSLHNRSGWYVGHYTPETGSYSASIGSTQTLQVNADALINTAVSPHIWAQQASGGGQARLPSGSINLSLPNEASVSSNLVGLNTIAPSWQNGPGDTQWPQATVQGAMHALIIQRNHLKRNAGSARRSHAISFAQEYFEYRLVGSSDNTVDGVNRGQLLLNGQALEVELITEYLAPAGWGDNDYCWRLFNNNNGYKGFEVQMRPVLYVLGQNLSLIGDIPDIAGDYTGTIELAYDALPTSRPVY
ncbi:MAG: hypothetical protein ACPGSC_02655 [Granulosicoccaceae bacterium]